MSKGWLVEVVKEKELSGVRDLIRREYTKQGFLQDEAAFLKLSAYLELATTTTFVVREEEKVVGTVSVIQYGDNGIPMGVIFSQEVEMLRKEGLVAEVGQLAIDREAVSRKEGMDMMFSLFLHVLEYAKTQGIDWLCIVVNPRHEAFYDRLGFETIGQNDFYRPVSASAVAKRLAIGRAMDNPIIQAMAQRVV